MIFDHIQLLGLFLYFNILTEKTWATSLGRVHSYQYIIPTTQKLQLLYN